MNIQSIRLDLDKRVTVAEHVVIGQGDKGGTTIVAHIFDHGVAYDLTGKSAMFEMRIPKQTEYVRDNCTVSGNTITYIVDEEHAAAAYGTTDCAYFDILIGNDIIASTARFTVDILRSARDGATPAQSWDTEIDELIERGEQAVSDAEQAVDDATSAIDAANQAIARIEPTIEEAAEEAAEQATADAEQRIQDAIDAMGDISELAVPEMSADVRGGAKLEEHGGLALRDGALGIGSLVQESDGYARGGLAEVTAKGHAEQVTTAGKNLLPNKLVDGTVNGITFTKNADGSIRATGTQTSRANKWLLSGSNRLVLPAGTYTLSDSKMGTFRYAYLELYDGGNRYINTINGAKTFTLDAETTFESYVSVDQTAAVDVTFYPQLELGSTATEYEPYTGGAPSPSPDYPQEIQVVRGRNLLEITGQTRNGITWSDDNGWLSYSGTATATYTYYYVGNQQTIRLKAGTYTLHATGDRNMLVMARLGSTGGTALLPGEGQGGSFTLSEDSDVSIFGWITGLTSGATYNGRIGFQLTLGSTPQPYVPYGHVGMEARDPDTDELISCTALPLPSRGWVAGLPDGTADSLTLDGAGKCEWTLPTKMLDLGELAWVTGTDSIGQYFRSYISGRLVVNTLLMKDKALCSKLLITDSGNVYDKSLGFSSSDTTIYARDLSSADVSAFIANVGDASLLYPLATPVTEDCGYVDMPEISGECEVSIPELDALGIKYFVDDTVTQYGREIYARVRSEYADRLTALEQAVAELATS